MSRRTIWFLVLLIYGAVSGGNQKLDTERTDEEVQSGNGLHLDKFEGLSTWEGALAMYPTVATWSLQTNIPWRSDRQVTALDEEEVVEEVNNNARGQKHNIKKKMKKYMMPLLIAYKLKFFTLIPVLIGGLILLTGATGLAGFFFALFAAVMGLKGGGHH